VQVKISDGRIPEHCGNDFMQPTAWRSIGNKTLRNWEQGIRRPGGAAAALLTAIRNDPKNVIAALNSKEYG
jgi:hypothetical protein